MLLTVFYFVCLVDRINTACDSSKATNDVSQAGDAYYCKDGMTWNNRVRLKLSDDKTAELDKLDTSTGRQYGKIRTNCGGGSDNPDIFTDISSWCAYGCAPLPEDYDTRWVPTYNYQSANAALDEAPIKAVKNYTASIDCKDGYAPKNGNSQSDTAFCQDDGWQPRLSNLIECASGCKDIRTKVEHGYSNNLRSTTLGGTPFNIGDVVTFTCQTGYELKGETYYTCVSDQSWHTKTYPNCVKKTTSTSTSGARGDHTDLVMTLNLLLFVAIQY